MEKSCELLGKQSIILQIILFVITCLILIIKRFHEFPKRKFIIFFLDNFKIFSGYQIIHFINLFFSFIFGTNTNSDQCIWYLNSVLIDCTFGLYINYLLLNFFGKIDKRFKTGNYFKQKNLKFKIDFKIWIYQVLIWWLIIAIMKIIVILIQIIFKNILEYIVNWVFNLLELSEYSKLIFCIVIFPISINTLQILVQDYILKKKEFKNEEKVLFKEYFEFEI